MRPDLSTRLAPFIERGLIHKVPSWWQVTQGSIEMMPYVTTPDPDDRRRYADAPLGHPLVRTPFIIAYTLGGHFNVGSGLCQGQRSIQKHLFAVHHFGQPVYDLQLAQTFPDGLENLRNGFLQLRHAANIGRRMERALVGAIVPRWDVYCETMLGHIDRASRFDYDVSPPAWARKEFWSLAAFMTYCAETFPPTLRGEHPLALLRRLYGLLRHRHRNSP